MERAAGRNRRQARHAAIDLRERRRARRRSTGSTPSGRAYTGCAGRWITSVTGPISTMRPAYMTATRSAVSAMTPMSCVISITAVPWSRHSRLSKAMICACIDTSSAVVGSSAMISFGFARERERDHDALAHAARKLVRILIDASLRRGDADLGQQFERAGPRGRRRQPEMGRNGFGQLAPDRVQRIERCQRILEHRTDLAAAHATQRLGRQVVDAPRRRAGPGRRRSARAGRSSR